jgi:hypothetical protein
MLRFSFSLLSILFSFSISAQDLDLDALGKGVEASSQYIVSPNMGTMLVVFFFFLFFFTLFFTTFLTFKKEKVAENSILKNLPLLKDWPLALKNILFILFFGYALVVIIAFLDIYVQTNVVQKNVSEYFFYRSAARLLGMSHAHLFGFTTLFTMGGIFFSFVQIKEWKKTFIVLSGIIAGIFDVGSWWGIKYISPHFEFFSQMAGMFFVFSLGTMGIILFRELYLKK